MTGIAVENFMIETMGIIEENIMNSMKIMVIIVIFANRDVASRAGQALICCHGNRQFRGVAEMLNFL
jgi:hypothetical protein